MNIAVVTLYTKNILKFASISIQSKRQYCAINDYTLVEYLKCIKNRHPAWNKIAILRRHIKDFDWLFWTDADAIILNMAIKLESFIDDDYNLIIAEDYQGINSGQFLLRGGDWSFRFLNEVWNQTQFLGHGWWEQAAIRYLIGKNPEIAKKVKLLPQRSFNSYLGNFEIGDFVLHVPNRGPRKRREAFDEWWPKAIGRMDTAVPAKHLVVK